METRKYLEALDEILAKRYPRKMYHIGGYQESAVCLQSQSNGWIVYNGERGNHYDEVFCNTVLSACMEFIRKLTHRVEDISAMENELLLAITRVA
jgi:hypothetical protein